MDPSLEKPPKPKNNKKAPWVKKKGLDEILYSHLKRNIPDQKTFENNKLIIEKMQTIFQEIKDKLAEKKIHLKSLHVFGSQLNGLALKSSDIDMTILTDHAETNYVAEQIFEHLSGKTIEDFTQYGFHRKFSMKLAYHPIIDKNIIRLSRIITEENPSYFQSIDIVMNGYDGLRNSLAILEIVETSPFYRNFAILLKMWSNQYHQRERLNTFSYYLLAAHFLQHVVRPRILPPIELSSEKIHALEKTSGLGDYRETGYKDGPKISELLIKFFQYYGDAYHLKKEKPEIWVEKTKGNLPRPEELRKARAVFDIVDPFWNLVGTPFNSCIAESKMRGHAMDMVRASFLLQNGKDIYSLKQLEREQIEREKRKAKIKLEKARRKKQRRMEEEEEFWEEEVRKKKIEFSLPEEKNEFPRKWGKEGEIKTLNQRLHNFQRKQEEVDDLDQIKMLEKKLLERRQEGEFSADEVKTPTKFSKKKVEVITRENQSENDFSEDEDKREVIKAKEDNDKEVKIKKRLFLAQLMMERKQKIIAKDFDGIEKWKLNRMLKIKKKNAATSDKVLKLFKKTHQNQIEGELSQDEIKTTTKMFNFLKNKVEVITQEHQMEGELNEDEIKTPTKMFNFSKNKVEATSQKHQSEKSFSEDKDKREGFEAKEDSDTQVNKTKKKMLFAQFMRYQKQKGKELGRIERLKLNRMLDQKKNAVTIAKIFSFSKDKVEVSTQKNQIERELSQHEIKTPTKMFNSLKNKDVKGIKTWKLDRMSDQKQEDDVKPAKRKIKNRIMLDQYILDQKQKAKALAEFEKWKLDKTLEKQKKLSTNPPKVSSFPKNNSLYSLPSERFSVLRQNEIMVNVLSKLYKAIRK